MAVSASALVADTSVFVDATAPYSLELQIDQNGETLCDISMEITEPDGRPIDTGCSLAASGNEPITVSGRVSGQDVSGKFDNTFQAFDMAPVTGALRDTSMDVGDRIDTYHRQLLALDPDLGDRFSIQTLALPDDLSLEAVIADAAVSAGTTIPEAMAAFVTRRIWLGDDNYIGPMNQRSKGTAPFDWPSLSEHLIYETLSPEDLPAPGTELRAWYDRVRVVFFYLTGNHAMIVWDPVAPDGAASFYSISMDNYQRPEPFLYADDTPVLAEDALLSPLVPKDWQNWLDAYFYELDIDPENPDQMIYDSSAPHGRFVLRFARSSGGFLRSKILPAVQFQDQTWWAR